MSQNNNQVSYDAFLWNVYFHKNVFYEEMKNIQNNMKTFDIVLSIKKGTKLYIINDLKYVMIHAKIRK